MIKLRKYIEADIPLLVEYLKTLRPPKSGTQGGSKAQGVKSLLVTV
jgi:hypothetical protein